MITVARMTHYHHMPESADEPDLTGLTLRQALRVLRSISWGDLGGMSCELSTGEWLAVELEPACGGGELTRTQRAVRESMISGRRTYYAVRT